MGTVATSSILVASCWSCGELDAVLSSSALEADRPAVGAPKSHFARHAPRFWLASTVSEAGADSGEGPFIVVQPTNHSPVSTLCESHAGLA